MLFFGVLFMMMSSAFAVPDCAHRLYPQLQSRSPTSVTSQTPTSPVAIEIEPPSYESALTMPLASKHAVPTNNNKPN